MKSEAPHLSSCRSVQCDEEYKGCLWKYSKGLRNQNIRANWEKHQ